MNFLSLFKDFQMAKRLPHLMVIFSLLATVSLFRHFTTTVSAAPDEQQQPLTVFSNPAPIAPADRASNTAGTNPGLPPAGVYPSTITVAGLTGTVTKVTVSFAITSTFPDDFDILLVGPTGAKTLIISDAGGSGDHTNVSFTFDQAAATAFPDQPTTPVPTGTYRPANFAGLAAPEPSGQDNFPNAGGLQSFPAPTLDVFNGTNPNGVWSLYVVDDQVIDTGSLPGGWSIDITTGGGPLPVDAVLDYNGDGKTDYTVVRNTGTGPNGQLTWYINNGTTSTITNWGIASDTTVGGDFDGDGKDDIAVYRPTSAPNSFFYILQSSTGTLVSRELGATGDDPTVVGDYDGDGKDDVAVYRTGATTGAQSFWYYRPSTAPGGIVFIQWGAFGHFPAPGDYDGDGKNDFCTQSSNGSGQGVFNLAKSGGGTEFVLWGNPSDTVVPGDYDGDGKTDFAVTRSSGGQYLWSVLGRNANNIIHFGQPWGLTATDFQAQGDYDGDGKTDIAIWRPNADVQMNFFYVRRSTDSTLQAFEWGQAGDYPVANYNSH